MGKAVVFEMTGGMKNGSSRTVSELLAPITEWNELCLCLKSSVVIHGGEDPFS